MDFHSIGGLKYFLSVLLIGFNVSEAHNVSSEQKVKLAKDDKMCTRQTHLLVDGYQKKELWALKVFDSWGKSQSGLFSGNLVNFGHYEQCLQMRQEFDSESDGTFQGQHCIIFFKDSPEVSNFTEDTVDLILPQNVHIDLMRQYMNFHNAKLGTALCVPSVCSASRVRLIADKMLAVNSMATTNDYDQENFCNTINILEMRSIDMFAA